MIQFGMLISGTALLALVAADASLARQAPDPREVYDLIRTNLPGVTDAQLQLAAVEGLVQQLQPRVWLVPTTPGTNTPSPLLTQTARFDGKVAYLRIGRVEAGLAAALRTAFDAQAATNPPAGLVLDLRFAGGEDYAAAAAVTDLFLTEEKPLLAWGPGSARSKAKTEALHLPVVVLVNRESSTAAEALAACLREVGAALVIGTNTAGRAMIAEDFSLSNGQHLRIARAGVRVGSDTVLTAEGLRPDILVAVSPAEEKVLWESPLKDLSTSAGKSASGATNIVATTTNRNQPERINEAVLVRERRKTNGPPTSKAAEVTPSGPLVRDPALARALDVLKALALVKQWRTP